MQPRKRLIRRKIIEEEWADELEGCGSEHQSLTKEGDLEGAAAEKDDELEANDELEGSDGDEFEEADDEE